jgi:hypothetical protein
MLVINKYVCVFTFHSANGFGLNSAFKSPTPRYVRETFFILLSTFIHYNSLYTSVLGRMVVDVEVKNGFP